MASGEEVVSRVCGGAHNKVRGKFRTIQAILPEGVVTRVGRQVREVRDVLVLVLGVIVLPAVAPFQLEFWFDL